ncbi:MAG: hypothetical protein GW859_05290 [Sphingomonadales bacterium]|nr:hypothetical protein [Sphingomonadales bacterium]
MDNPPHFETHSEEETEARREAAQKRMMATPPKPQEKMKTPAKPKPRRGKSGQKKEG